MNDYYDREGVLINHPERPIPSGEIVPRNALIYSSILFLLALISAFFINICSAHSFLRHNSPTTLRIIPQKGRGLQGMSQ